MISLYQLSYSSMIALISSILLILLLQMFCFVHVFFSFRFNQKLFWHSMLDIVILLQLFLLLAFTSDVFFNMQNGFILDHNWEKIRILLCIVLIILGIILTIQEKSLYPLGYPAAAVLTLPAVEDYAGNSFPLVLLIALFFWFLQICNQLVLFYSHRKTDLSAFSVKEAVDSLDFGILFCRKDRRSDGTVLLTNRKMQELIIALTGSFSYNGKTFYESLVKGNVQSGCIRSSREHLVYTLPNGRVWWFKPEFISVDSIPCAVLTAADITEEKQTTDKLNHSDAELNRRNQKLTTMLKNMQSICHSEEILHAKNRVHDLLSQQISLFLRSIREHREPDEKLLQSFANGLPEQLKNDVGQDNPSLRSIAKSFRNIGVDVQINGDLPPQPDLQQLFTEIGIEAMTNAVRHGYATRICITINNSLDWLEMQITDNGTVKNQPIQEGGGLKSMRSKTLAAGGEFSYKSYPKFEILVRIPGGRLS